jgi:hypothetical protein
VPQQAAEEEVLKVTFAIAALFLAAVFLVPAQAATVLTTTLPTGTLGTSANLYLSGSGYTGNGNGYIIAYGWDDIFPGTSVAPPTYSSPAHTENLKVGSDSGLGLANSTDNGEIGITDGIVLDFADVDTTLGGGGINKVTIDINKDITGGAYYMIYGMSNANGTGTAVLLTSALLSSTGLVSFSTSTVFASYVIGLTNADCAIDLKDVQVQYSSSITTPEPGTFVMGGMALLGLGVIMKKRRQKV